MIVALVLLWCCCCCSVAALLLLSLLWYSSADTLTAMVCSWFGSLFLMCCCSGAVFPALVLFDVFYWKCNTERKCFFRGAIRNTCMRQLQQPWSLNSGLRTIIKTTCKTYGSAPKIKEITCKTQGSDPKTVETICETQGSASKLTEIICKTPGSAPGIVKTHVKNRDLPKLWKNLQTAVICSQNDQNHS